MEKGTFAATSVIYHSHQETNLLFSKKYLGYPQRCFFIKEWHDDKNRQLRICKAIVAIDRCMIWVYLNEAFGRELGRRRSSTLVRFERLARSNKAEEVSGWKRRSTPRRYCRRKESLTRSAEEKRRTRWGRCRRQSQPKGRGKERNERRELHKSHKHATHGRHAHTPHTHNGGRGERETSRNRSGWEGWVKERRG